MVILGSCLLGAETAICILPSLALVLLLQPSLCLDVLRVLGVLLAVAECVGEELLNVALLLAGVSTDARELVVSDVGRFGYL